MQQSGVSGIGSDSARLAVSTLVPLLVPLRPPSARPPVSTLVRVADSVRLAGSGEGGECTPLLMCVQYKHHEAVRLLLEYPSLPPFQSHFAPHPSP